MQFFIQGYEQDVEQILKFVMFWEEYSEMVLVKDIELYFLCEYYLLLFFGKVYVVYIFNGYIVGLSKILWVIDVFVWWLQVQECLMD